MKSLKSFFAITITLFALICSCKKPEPEKPFIPIVPNGPGQENTFPKPGEAKTMVVAHRGGSIEAGRANFPDNSIASLRYAMSLDCYASEIDIYWTKDNDVIVAHADGNGKINGMYPWEHTLQEIQNAGKLSNGETIPSLRDYITVVMEEGSRTKLWIDIKNITIPKQMSVEVVNGCRRACEIATEMEAINFIEFICTGHEIVYMSCKPLVLNAGMNIGWMANKSAAEYASNANQWCNLSIEHFKTIGTGSRTIDEFYEKKVDISVYNADSDAQMNFFIAKKDLMKAICTNYPKKLINKMK